MIKLYHMAESTCAQRVRLTLAEKELEWTSEIVPPSDLRSPDYLALNPAGVVPTLLHDNLVLNESRVICEYLEDAWPHIVLVPQSPTGRYHMRRWTKLYDDKLHMAMFIPTFLCWMRRRYEAMPEDVRRQALPGLKDPVKRGISKDLYDNGWKSVHLTLGMRDLLSAVQMIDSTLSEQRWLGGEYFSLADIDMLVVLQRLSDLGMSDIWMDSVAIVDWLERCRNRVSFQKALTEWRTREVDQQHKAMAAENAPNIRSALAHL